MPTDFGDKKSFFPKIRVQKVLIPLCGIHMGSTLVSTQI